MLDNIASANGLLPGDTKPLAEPLITYYELDPKEQT